MAKGALSHFTIIHRRIVLISPRVKGVKGKKQR